MKAWQNLLQVVLLLQSSKHSILLSEVSASQLHFVVIAYILQHLALNREVKFPSYSIYLFHCLIEMKASSCFKVYNSHLRRLLGLKFDIQHDTQGTNILCFIWHAGLQKSKLGILILIISVYLYQINK